MAKPRQSTSSGRATDFRRCSRVTINTGFGARAATAATSLSTFTVIATATLTSFGLIAWLRGSPIHGVGRSRTASRFRSAEESPCRWRRTGRICAGIFSRYILKEGFRRDRLEEIWVRAIGEPPRTQRRDDVGGWRQTGDSSHFNCTGILASPALIKAADRIVVDRNLSGVGHDGEVFGARPSRARLV